MHIWRRKLFGMACIAGLISTLPLILACEQQESEFVSGLQREWISTKIGGGEERVSFEPLTAHWNHGTDEAYSCPYRVMSFDEEERHLTIHTRCKQRTGSDGTVAYLMRFEEDRQSFTMELEGRPVGIFRAAAAE